MLNVICNIDGIFIYSFSKYLLSAFHMPDTVLGTVEIAINKTAPGDMNLTYFSWSRQTINKQVNIHYDRRWPL